jgi:hypothetical protein
LRAWARQGNPEKEKLKLLQLLLSLAMTKRWLDSGLRRNDEDGKTGLPSQLGSDKIDNPLYRFLIKDDIEAAREEAPQAYLKIR